MTDTIITVLIFMPLILSVIASVIFFRMVSRPTLFFLAVTLSMLGLQGIFAPAATYALLPSYGSPATFNESFNHGVLVSAILQLVVGIPFIWWLANGLRKP